LLDTDELAVSQGGIVRKITRAQLLAGVHSSLSIGSGQILAGPSNASGPPQSVSVGGNLILADGTLSASGSTYSIGSLPAGATPAASNLVGVSESGTDVSVSYAAFMSGISGLSGINLSAQSVVPTGSTSAQTLANLVADMLPRSGGQITGPLLLASDPTLTTQATTKHYVDQRVMRAGDTMAGTLTLAADPTQPLQAATKDYVDSRLYMTGDQPFSNDTYSSPEAVQLGGFTFNDGRAITIRGAPYGYYDTGTLLSIVATQNPLTWTRAGINGGFEQGVPAVAGDQDFDSVLFYLQPTAMTPRIVTSGVSYDAGNVHFDPPLTAAQVALLHTSMWIITNSINPSVPVAYVANLLPTPTGTNPTRPVPRRYASTIIGWASDGSSIQVSGWTVPGSGNTASGQVPGTANLDTTGGHTTPTVFIGAPTKQFAQNWFMEYDPKGNPDSQIHQLTGLEVDMDNNGTDHYQVCYQGMSIAYNSINPSGAASDGRALKPTDDSFCLLLYGGETMPVGLRTHWFSAAQWDGDGIWIPGPAEVSPALPAGSTNLMAEVFQNIDSNIQRLLIWGSRDTNGGSGGWPNASLRIGLQIGGTKGTLSGAQMAQIAFNPPGYAGGLGLAGGSGFGLYVTASGAVVVPNLPTSPSGLPHGSLWRSGNSVMIV
jgi:hypothetical protein